MVFLPQSQANAGTKDRGVPTEVEINQMIVNGFAQFQRLGMKTFDPQKIAEASLDFPLVIATYHHLTVKSVQRELKNVKVLTAAGHKLEFYRAGKKFLEVSGFNIREATFKANDHLFDLKKIHTMEDFAREVAKVVPAKTAGAVLYDWLIPRAKADDTSLIRASLSLYIDLVTPNLLIYYNGSTMAADPERCKSVVTESITRADIIIGNMIKACKTPGVTLDSQAVPEVAERAVLQAPEAGSQGFSAEDVSQTYLENFRDEKFSCETVLKSMKNDLAENPVSDRAKNLQKSIANLPNTSKAKAEDIECVKRKLQAPAAVDSRALEKRAAETSPEAQ